MHKAAFRRLLVLLSWGSIAPAISARLSAGFSAYGYVPFPVYQDVNGVEKICKACQTECEKFPKVAECKACGDACKQRTNAFPRLTAIPPVRQFVAPWGGSTWVQTDR
jgi:hypothetical protein